MFYLQRGRRRQSQQAIRALSEREKLDRQDIVYEHQAPISYKRLARHIGNTLEVIIDGKIDDQVVAERYLMRQTLMVDFL
ncbi:MAG: hypothetical protein Ct9H90mP27_0430 [Gammaproteobacteria bacterium]|nr:MAG: hypothetical protein Ct9H90mP27_0430 [Gammaproteobacteria bacterium]